MAKRKSKPIEPPPASPRVACTVSCPVHDSFRVQQVAGMFDVPAAKKSERTFDVEIPAREELIDGQCWQIGVIVGPSGSGKSTIARQAFGAQLYETRPGDWPADRAVVDCFPEAASIRDVTQLLHAVGFSTPPASAIVAVCQLVDCVELKDLAKHSRMTIEQTRWAFGPWCWILADVQVLQEPIPCAGALSLWQLPADVQRQLRLGKCAPGAR